MPTTYYQRQKIFGASEGELYDIFPPAAPTALAVTVSRLTDLWHRRLGRPRDATFCSNKVLDHCNKPMFSWSVVSCSSNRQTHSSTIFFFH